MGLIKSPDELPEVSFIGDLTLEEVRAQMVADYSEKYEELTGITPELPADDRNRVLLGVCALQIYQGYKFIEQAGRMNLLKYATGESLDNLAALKNVKRGENSKSTVTIRFVKHSDFVRNDITVPRLTRVAAENHEIYWMTPNIDVTIPAGRTYIDIDCTCTEDGSFSNGFEINEINRLVDSVPFLMYVNNITVSKGGSDYENDDALRLRILNAPSGFSAAGSADSYRYCIQQLDSQIADVSIQEGENDGELTAYILTKSGRATEEQVASFQALIDNADFRPLTDKVTVESATPVTYGIDVKYYIAKKDASKVTTIRMAIEDAIDEFAANQENELGKDINPSVLIQAVMNAGACRVILSAPTYMQVGETNYSFKTYRTTQYMGLE